METHCDFIFMFGIGVQIVIKHTVALILDRLIVVDIRIGINAHTCESVALLSKFSIEKAAVVLKSFLYLKKINSLAER